MLPNHIHDLIVVAKEQKKASGVDQKWANKTIARLEEAQLFSEKMFTGRVLGVPVSPSPMRGTPAGTGNPNQHVACVCPTGAVDKDCPVHGG